MIQVMFQYSKLIRKSIRIDWEWSIERLSHSTTVNGEKWCLEQMNWLTWVIISGGNIADWVRSVVMWGS